MLKVIGVSIFATGHMLQTKPILCECTNDKIGRSLDDLDTGGQLSLASDFAQWPLRALQQKMSLGSKCIFYL